MVSIELFTAGLLSLAKPLSSTVVVRWLDNDVELDCDFFLAPIKGSTASLGFFSNLVLTRYSGRSYSEEQS
jgi:hypothetical protein